MIYLKYFRKGKSLFLFKQQKINFILFLSTCITGQCIPVEEIPEQDDEICSWQHPENPVLKPIYNGRTQRCHECICHKKQDDAKV
jgi:hypothetical protein